MKKVSLRILHEESAILTFEWILLITVLVIGITGGLSAVRDAYNWELGGTAGAIVALDLSYWIKSPVKLLTTFGTTLDEYQHADAAGTNYEYTPPKIYYRPRPDATIGGGTGMLQPGGNGITPQTQPQQTINYNPGPDSPTFHP